MIGKEIYHDFFTSKLLLNSEATLQQASTKSDISKSKLAAIFNFVSKNLRERLMKKEAQIRSKNTITEYF